MRLFWFRDLVWICLQEDYRWIGRWWCATER